ncbi:MAG TPA: hypothetical protein VH703_04370 [Solirubrobacterales bacterium]|jgi:hypothetical protein
MLAGLLLLWRHRPPRSGERTDDTRGGSAGASQEPEETHRFSRRDVLVRLKSHSPNHYAGLYNVMKGVTLAAVGFSLVKLFSHSVPPERAALLAVALLSVLISYNGEAIGQTIIHLYPATIDVFLPMALTVALLLVVGLPGADKDLGPMPLAWFISLGAWNLIAAVLVASIASRLDVELYEPYLHSTVDKYRRRMWVDATCAAVVGVAVFAFAWIRAPYLPAADAWEYGFLIAVAVSLLGGLAHHEAIRRELKAELLATAGSA